MPPVDCSFAFAASLVVLERCSAVYFLNTLNDFRGGRLFIADDSAAISTAEALVNSSPAETRSCDLTISKLAENAMRSCELHRRGGRGADATVSRCPRPLPARGLGFRSTTTAKTVRPKTPSPCSTSTSPRKWRSSGIKQIHDRQEGREVRSVLELHRVRRTHLQGRSDGLLGWRAAAEERRRQPRSLQPKPRREAAKADSKLQHQSAAESKSRRTRQDRPITAKAAAAG